MHHRDCGLRRDNLTVLELQSDNVTLRLCVSEQEPRIGRSSISDRRYLLRIHRRAINLNRSVVINQRNLYGLNGTKKKEGMTVNRGQLILYEPVFARLEDEDRLVRELRLDGGYAGSDRGGLFRGGNKGDANEGYIP